MQSKIKELAEARGMTLYELSRRTGLTPNALYKWERVGLDKAQFGAVLKVAEALGCDPRDLYGA